MIDTSSPTLPATVSQPSCHSSGPAARRMGWRSGLVIAGGAAAGIGAAAYGLNQSWFSVATLAPLLFSLPCAVMMLVCMRGMSRKAPAQPTPPSAPWRPASPSQKTLFHEDSGD